MKEFESKIEEIEKEKEKKKKFSFKRLFAYIGLYVILSFCFAFVIVLGTDTTSSLSTPTLGGEEDVPPSAFANLVNNLMTMEDFSTNLNLDVETPESTNFKISGKVDVVLYEGYSGAEVDANIKLVYNEQSYDLNLLYKNEYIYLSVNDYNYTFNTSTFISGLMMTLQTFGINVGGLDSLFQNFDMSILNDIESLLSEEQFDDYNLLTLSAFDGLQVKIQTDKNYAVNKIYFDEFVLEGYNLCASIDLFDVNNNKIIEIPQKDYVDITQTASLLNVLSNTINENVINANISVVGENSFNANLVVDRTENIKLQLLSNLYNKDLILHYENETVYASFDKVMLKANVQDIDDIFLQ